jgi:hypothetical protein
MVEAETFADREEMEACLKATGACLQKTETTIKAG